MNHYILMTLLLCVSVDFAWAQTQEEVTDEIDKLIAEIISRRMNKGSTKPYTLETTTTTEATTTDWWLNEEPKLGKVDYKNLSAEFRSAFELDDLENPELSLRKRGRSDQGVCLKDTHVSRMVHCLARYFEDARIKDAVARNYLRKFIHKKNVKAWFYYLHHCFHIKLSAKNLAVIVKCYLNEIPT